MSKRGLKRMAQRMVKRAGIEGEEGVTVSFGFSSLAAAIVVGFLEELPYIGLALTFATFVVHRFVLVTDQHTYIIKGRPFHRPGAILGKYPVAAGTVTRVRGKLTFPDGQVVWHSPVISYRVARVEAAANAGSLEPTAA
jgi:hypothetical protein